MGAVKYLGKSGKVYAFDLWEEGIEHLSEKAKRKGYKKIYPLVVDLSQEIPLPETTVDTALIATALHDLIQDGSAVKTVEEAYRVLKDKGKLAIVEFKKIEHLPLRQKVFVCRLKNEESISKDFLLLNKKPLISVLFITSQFLKKSVKWDVFRFLF